MQPLTENLNYSAERIAQCVALALPTMASAKPFTHNPRKLEKKGSMAAGWETLLPTTAGAIGAADCRRSLARKNMRRSASPMRRRRRPRCRRPSASCSMA